jgi:hypothetical protein
MPFAATSSCKAGGSKSLSSSNAKSDNARSPSQLLVDLFLILARQAREQSAESFG